MYTGWVYVVEGFPGSWDGKESACNVGGPGSVPGWWRSSALAGRFLTTGPSAKPLLWFCFVFKWVEHCGSSAGCMCSQASRTWTGWHFNGWRVVNSSFKKGTRTSLVAKWIRISLPMQGTQVQSQGWEDSICCWASKLVSYWAHVLQLLSLYAAATEACAAHLCSTREATAMRSLCTVTE